MPRIDRVFYRTVAVLALGWAFAAAFLLASPPPALAQESVPPPSGGEVTAERWERLGTYVDGVAAGEMSTLSVPGLVTVIRSREHGSIIRAYGVGDADGTIKVDPRSDAQLVPIASISKLFVSLALAKAQEQGLLNLDDEANKHLDFKLGRYPGARAITLRDLARHESGLEERWLATGAGAELDPRPWGEILAQTQPKPIAPPGAYASYSNYGIGLLGYIVEKASGRPYHEYVREEILEPAGMNGTVVIHPLPDSETRRVLRGLSSRGGMWRDPGADTYNVRTYPAGRVLMTLTDIDRLLELLLNEGRTEAGEQVLEASSLRELLNADSRSHPAMTGMGVIFAQKDIAGTRFIGHGGDGGTHHTDLLVSPDKGYAIFVGFLSAPGPQARDYFTRAVVPFIEGRDDLWSVTPQAKETDVDLSRFAGQYRHYRWAFTSIERLLQLTSEFSVKDSGAGSLIVTGRLGEGEYVPVDLEEGLFRHRLTGEYLHFSESFDGRQNLNMGTFPFVTAFKLTTWESQSGATMAFAILIGGLLIAGLILFVRMVVAWFRRRWQQSIGEAMLATSSLVASLGTLAFLMIASSQSESALQQRVPPQADWLLALPFVAAALTMAYWIGVLARRWRPSGWFGWVVALIQLALIVGFLIFLNEWNALGWNYP